MTTYEHAMLGIDGTLALGLHRRYGWKVAAMAGLAAIAPDWDGLTILFSRSLFAEDHRVWGHNLLACVIVGLLLGSLDYRFDVVTRVARRIVQLLRIKIDKNAIVLRREVIHRDWFTWVLVAVIAALSQLPADMVVSGSKGLPDWEIKVLWPFSSRGWVYPMVEWGDPGITIVFVLGMFGMLRFPNRLSIIAICTLLGVAAYIGLRRFV